MRTLILFLSLFFVASLAAQERNYQTMQMGMEFRGKTLVFEATKNPDGTWNDTYRDGEGNPLSELEQHVIQGNEKLGRVRSDRSDSLTGLLGPDLSNSLLLITGLGSFPGFGENPEFRDWSGITLEQVRNMRLAMWELEDYPPDELVDIFVQAALTEDAEELKTLKEAELSHSDEFSKKMYDTLVAELTPEQIQKLWELKWHMPGGSVFIGGEEVSVNFGRYNALDLSEEQKELLETLKKNFLQAAPELNKLSGQVRNQKLIEHVKATRGKLRDMLTDAQKAKLDRLLAEKPKFLTEPATPPPSPSDEKEREVWVPGPDSWKPGDPLPPGVLPPPPPAGRFPRL